MKQLEDIPWFICDSNKDNYIAYSDTDSIYIDCDKLVKSRFKNWINLSDNEKDNCVELVAKEYENKINKHYNKIAKEIFNITKKDYNSKLHHLEMKTECVIRKGYFRNKRRYAQWIVSEEGIKTDKIDVVGLEFQKANFPPIIKEFFGDILDNIIKGIDKNIIDNKVIEFINKIKTGKVNYKDLGNPTKVNKLDKYYTNEYINNSDFATIQSKTPINVKSSISYNDLLKLWKLNDKHTTITNGDKVKWIYLTDNEFNLKSISFIEHDIPSKMDEFLSNHIDIDRVFNSIILNKLDGLYSDLEWILPEYRQ